MFSVTELTVDNYCRQLEREFPKLLISDKKPWWLRVVFGLPGIKKLEWNNATQTIGMNIYLSDRWKEFSSKAKMSTLRHEREHLLQFSKYGLVGMAILYLFIFFPVGLAYFRARFERAGFAESVRARIEYWGPTETMREDCEQMYLRVFMGSTYLWPWPFRKTVLRWFSEDWNKAVEGVNSVSQERSTS